MQNDRLLITDAPVAIFRVDSDFSWRCGFCPINFVKLLYITQRMLIEHSVRLLIIDFQHLNDLKQTKRLNILYTNLVVLTCNTTHKCKHFQTQNTDLDTGHCCGTLIFRSVDFGLIRRPHNCKNAKIIFIICTISSSGLCICEVLHNDSRHNCSIHTNT